MRSHCQHDRAKNREHDPHGRACCHVVPHSRDGPSCRLSRQLGGESEGREQDRSVTEDDTRGGDKASQRPYSNAPKLPESGDDGHDLLSLVISEHMAVFWYAWESTPKSVACPRKYHVVRITRSVLPGSPYLPPLRRISSLLCDVSSTMAL